MYAVLATTGWAEKVLYDGLSYSEAEEICVSNGYEVEDEEGIVWDLSITWRA